MNRQGSLSRSCLSDHAKCNGNAETSLEHKQTHTQKQPTQGMFLFVCLWGVVDTGLRQSRYACKPQHPMDVFLLGTHRSQILLGYSIYFMNVILNLLFWIFFGSEKSVLSRINDLDIACNFKSGIGLQCIQDDYLKFYNTLCYNHSCLLFIHEKKSLCVNSNQMSKNYLLAIYNKYEAKSGQVYSLICVYQCWGIFLL